MLNKPVYLYIPALLSYHADELHALRTQCSYVETDLLYALGQLHVIISAEHMMEQLTASMISCLTRHDLNLPAPSLASCIY
jgi:hypothetical protein